MLWQKREKGVNEQLLSIQQLSQCHVSEAYIFLHI